MEEKINNLLSMYKNCFKDLECAPLNLDGFILYFYINNNNLLDSLISMDRRIYHQRQILREFCFVYQDSYDDFRELWERLNRVHKEILKVLKEDFRICECWIDKDTNEIQYSQEP